MNIIHKANATDLLFVKITSEGTRITPPQLTQFIHFFIMTFYNSISNKQDKKHF